MKYNAYQWLAVLAAIVLCVLVCHAIFAEDAIPERAGIQALRATMQLGPEVQRLMKEQPLREPVEIVVFHADVQAWTEFTPRKNPIYIRDSGHSENVKALRHEWQHRVDFERGVKMSEESAKGNE